MPIRALWQRRMSALLILAVFALAATANAQSKSSATPRDDVREVKTLWHQEFLRSVVFSPDGRTIASGSGDSTVKLWDAASGQELQTLRHSDKVESVAFSPDGQMIASGGADHTVRLWDAASGRELQVLQTSDWIDSVAFSRDGQTIAVGSDYNEYAIVLWDVANGRKLRELKGHKSGVLSLAFSPDGQTLVSGSYDHMIKLWDAASGSELRTLGGHSGYVWSVALSPDGRTIVSGSEDHTIKLWDAATGRELRTLRGHTDEVRSVAFSPDGKMIASAGKDRKVKLWDAATGRELRTLRGHTELVASVAFSPDGRTIASGSDDKTLKLWDISALSPAEQPAAIRKYVGRPPNVTPSEAPPVVSAAIPAAMPSAIPAPALRERRVALVIGNSAYRNVQHLPNPSNDANLIGAALRSTGIEDVTIAHDLDREGMVAALKAFARKVDAADWAVVYFAGHGIEVGGTNYLIPVDAKLETDRDVAEEAISLDQLQSKLAGAHKLKLIVLDACRNNPFASQMKMTVAHRSVSRGFTRFEPNGATLVVYAAKEGTTANDGDDADSPFAVSFAKRIVERGIEINMVLRFVRQDVLLTTGNQQEPFVYGSLPPENFYFVEPK